MDARDTGGKAAALLDNARSLVPVLRERAVDANRARDVPAATIADCWDLGLFGALRPAKYGGDELRYDDFLALGRELGRGDGSAAWVYSVMSVHELLAALFPEEVQEEVFADPRSMVAASFAPTGRAAPAGGGWRLSGKWSFCSGVNHAGWILLSAVCGTRGTPPEPDIRYAMARLDEGCRIVDDWHVAGLCGTGSASVVVDDLFVPEIRVVPLADLAAGAAPGGAVHEGHIYRAPMFAVFPFCLAAPATGIARGALERFVEGMRTRDSQVGRAPLRDMRHIRMRAAEAAALTDAAELLYRRSATETVDLIEAGTTPDLGHRLRSRRDQTYSVVMATRAVELLAACTGGHGLYDSDPVQRAWRDLQALGRHVATTWDIASASYGSVLLGGEPTDAIH